MLHHGIFFYSEIFVIVFILSTLFALGGIGFAIAFVPILHFLGYDFNVAKAIGLFLNSLSTGVGALRNWKKKVLDVKFASILTIFSLLGTILGSYLSKFIPIYIIKIFFILFLIFAIFLLIFGKNKQQNNLTSGKHGLLVPSVIGFFVGVLSGMLGIGGGNIFIPLLLLLGYNVKYIARNMSFVVAISTFGGFLVYLTFVEIDWILILVASIASLLGGWLGNYLMNEKLKADHIRYILAFLLFLVVVKMIRNLIFGR